jgi:predicted DNA-binding antitoxin AbrB/MazE fold protein
VREYVPDQYDLIFSQREIDGIRGGSPGGRTMALEVEAVYENGVLKPDKPLPLDERERVTVFVQPRSSRIRQSAGLMKWTGDEQALDSLLGPGNLPWEKS